jgi:hypothetical protein|tara:strand:+ start:130 stop:318 length:189 start_codon:yes stop_codon:yes gene_type:complete
MDLAERKTQLLSDLKTLEQRFNVAQENVRNLTADIHRVSGALALLEEQLVEANGLTEEAVAE